MNSVVGERYTVELLALFEQQGESLYSGQHSLCLTLPCLFYLQRKFSSLQEGSSDPIARQFPALQQLQENLGRILSLKLISDKVVALPSTATLNVEPFKALQTLVLKKIPLKLVTGLQRLRGQLKTLVVQRCHVGVEMNTRLLDNIEEVVVKCCGDESTSFAWNSLKELDLSNNSISKLGDSLQYLPYLEKVNFSHNRIGSAPGHASSSTLTGSVNATEQSQSAADVATISVTSVSTEGLSYTEGIEYIDIVTFLHLGFNNLRCIPKFGTKAKYNLRILNLRNNQLENIDGLRELDRLVELDLTDNMLIKHSSLEPFQNLHHLSVVTLQGNPLAYHPKHRIKTAKHLSNLINRINFRLDGKKLSAAEKKVISSSLTHYAPVPPAWSPVSSQSYSLAMPLPISSASQHQSPFENDQVVASSMPNPDHHRGNAGFTFASAPNTPKDRDSVLEQQPKRWQIAKLVETGKEDAPVAIPADDGGGGGGAASGSKGRSKGRKRDEHVPVDNALLVNSEELANFKTVRNEMQDSWLKTNPNPVNVLSSDSTTDDTSSSSGKHQRSSLSRSSSQQPAQAGGGGVDTSQGKSNLSRSSSVKKPKRRRRSHSKDNSSSRRGSRRSKKISGGGGAGEKKPLASEAVEEECGGEYGPRASSPVQPVMSGEEGGDWFLVERYESDIEEEGGASASSHTPKKAVKGEKQLMLVISERFLEERSSMGDKLMDKWDLNTLQQASIEKKPWKSSSSQSSGEADSQLHDVLSLQFNLERRDRSRREYVLLEEEDDTESLLSLLEPIIQRNQESLSLLNRVECLACQHVFDVSQAFEQPSDEPQPLNSSSFAGRKRSLSKLLCPYCSSPILQYSMPGARSLRKTPSSYSPGQIPGMTSPEAGSPRKVVASEDNVQSGFSVGGPRQVDDSGRSGQPSTLMEETQQQSQDVRESSIEKNKGSSPLVNGFNEDPESLKTLGGDPFASSEPSSPLKNTTEEQKSRKQSETAGDDLSPWKKPKPVSLTVPPPPPSPPPPKAKVSTNPFDGMEDDHLQKEPSGVPVGGAQVPVVLVPSATGGMENGNGPSEIERRSHDQGPTGGAAAVTGGGGGGGRNPFDSDITGKNPFDHEFSYEYEEPKPTAEVPEEPLVRSRSGAISDAFTRRSADLALSPMLESPVTEASMSVPAQYHIHDYMSQASGSGGGRERGNHGKAAPRDLESLLYEQSRRSGGERHPSKSHNVTPPSTRKQYNYSPSSTRKQYRDTSSPYGSLKNSSGSTHSIDSLRNELSSGKGAKGSSLERGVKLRGSGGANKVYDGGAKRYSSPSLSKNSPTSPRRTPTSSGSHHRASSGSGSEMRRRVHPGPGSGGENSSGSGRGSRRNSGNLRGSSDGTTIKGSSPLALLKDDEPTYIHSNLNLYLDMEVFNTDKGEHFKMVFKSPVMQYGHKLEIPAVAVVSSYKFYIFKIIGPESTNAQQWLDLIAVHHLKKLVYIDHGVGHQYLRVEFLSESACYTFLIRNDKKCTLCATMLAHIVTDVSKSSFRTVGVVPFTVDSIRYPERVLREVIMTRYDKIKSIRSGAKPTSSPSLRLHRHINPDSRPASTTSLADDDEMVMYRLVQRIISGDKSKKRNRVQLTLVLTEQAIYLGKENFAQWPLPKVQELPKRDDLKPPFSNVIRKNINDVEQIVLDRDQSTYVSLRFFKELNEVSMSGDDDSKWSLIMQSAACVKKIVDTIKSRWEAQFETTLPVLRK